MKEVAITRGQIMLVDDCDYAFVEPFHWIYAHSTNTGYAQASIGGNIVGAHRYILGYPNSCIDHIDGNGLNNQRSNLRVCSWAQNAQHCHKRADNQSGYRGVSKQRNGWVANIRHDGIKHYLGYYHSAILAALVYDEAAKKYHRDFASLNFKEVN